MTVDEAIKTAIEYETKVLSVYKDAVEKSDDPTGKRVFGALADEEQHHLDYLNHKLDQLRASGELTAGKIETTVPSPEILRQGMERLPKGMAIKNISDEIQLLEKALEVEIETSDFYERMADEMTGQAKKMFTRFVEIENGHKSIVHSEIDSLNGSGFWFGFQEFDMED